MRAWMISGSYVRRTMFALWIAAAAGCMSSGDRMAPPEKPEVYRIDSGMANVYFVRQHGKLLMIDTSLPEHLDRILARMKDLGLNPADVAVLVVTHGHGDHAGNARYFQQKYGTKVAGGEGDLDKFQRGMTDLSKAESIGIMARMIRPMSDGKYDPFTPDIIVKDQTDLTSYGFDGTILLLPGHTPGSVVVILGDIAFTGDLIRGGMVMRHSPTEHFFHEDRARARAQLTPLLERGVKTLFPGHFGPLDAADISAMIAEK